MDGFDMLAAAGVIILGVGLGLLAPWLALAVVGAIMIATGIVGARTAARSDQVDDQPTEDPA